MGTPQGPESAMPTDMGHVGNGADTTQTLPTGELAGGQVDPSLLITEQMATAVAESAETATPEPSPEELAERQAALDEAITHVDNAQNAWWATHLLTRSQHLGAEERPTSWKDLRAAYADADERRRVSTVEHKTGRDGFRVQFLTDLRIGSQDAAVEHFEEAVNWMGDLPQDQKPDVVVMSNVIVGSHNYLEKPKRMTVIDRLDSMDTQFGLGREAIEMVQEAGPGKVIYTLGEMDARTAEEYTLETMMRMRAVAKGWKSTEKHADLLREEGLANDFYADLMKASVSWKTVDNLRAHPEWKTHLQFQTDVVYPFCLTHGRRLKTAEEMREATDGDIAVDEYFVLFNAAEAAERGEDIPAEHLEWLKKTDEDYDPNIVVVNDFDMTVKTDKRRRDVEVRRHLNFSAKPKYKSFMGKQMTAMSERISAGEDFPDLFVTTHNMEAIGVGALGTWSISTGPLQDPERALHADGGENYVNGDDSRRMFATRGRMPKPSSDILEFKDDGRMILTVSNSALTEKQATVSERQTIAEICDLQSGSITARPEILVNYLDYLRTRVLGENALSIYFGGDMMHGRNYPHFPTESGRTMLMGMDAQENFNIALFNMAFADMSPEELDGIDRVVVQPGNHEWNSGTLKWHGYSFVRGMQGVFREMFAQQGLTREEMNQKVKTYYAAMTERGELLTGYTGVERYGDGDPSQFTPDNSLGFLIQHYLLERGGKGSGGDAPVYQGHAFANGASDLMKWVDVMMSGHWHHEQYAVFKNKLSLVAGSIAGLSDYEMKRAYRASISAMLIHFGGSLPVQVEFIPEETLHNHVVTKGDFTRDSLRTKGYGGETYRNQRGHDPHRHGIWMPRQYPKSATQQALLHMAEDAATGQLVDGIAKFFAATDGGGQIEKTAEQA